LKKRKQPEVALHCGFKRKGGKSHKIIYLNNNKFIITLELTEKQAYPGRS
jgi:hypothetical protein